jgi:RNA-binding protein
VKFSKSGNHRPQVRKVKVLGNQRVTAGGEIKRVRHGGARKSTPKKAMR